MGGGASTVSLPTVSGEKLTFQPVPYKTHEPKHRAAFHCFLDVEIMDATFAGRVETEPGGAAKQRTRTSAVVET